MAKVWQPDRFQDDPPLQGKARERLREIDNAYDRLQDYFRLHREPEGSGQATGEDRAATREVSGGDDVPPILPPPIPQPPVSSGAGKEKKSHAGVIFGVVVVIGIIVVLIIAGSSGGSGVRLHLTAFLAAQVPLVPVVTRRLQRTCHRSPRLWTKRMDSRISTSG